MVESIVATFLEAPTRSVFLPKLAASVIVACAATALAMPAAGVEHYEGEAYALAGATPLYRESHWRYDDEGVAKGLVLYLCPDGSPFARKHIRATASAQAPDFDLVDARDGYSEGVRGKGNAREVYVRSNAVAPERTAELKDHSALVVDAGFDAFVRSHWDALNGSAATLDFLVPSRLGAMNFQVSRIGAEKVDGRDAQRFRLALARWYGGLLPHIDVVYDDATRNLVRYEGMSNMRDASARNLVVRIEFPTAERDTQATPADVAAAASAPLTGTCPLS